MIGTFYFLLISFAARYIAGWRSVICLPLFIALLFFAFLIQTPVNASALDNRLTKKPKPLKVSSISKNCTGDGKAYVVLFEISGGDQASYKVIDNASGRETGSLYFTFFESGLIPSGNYYSFSVFDGKGSDTIIVVGKHACVRPKDIFQDPKKEEDKTTGAGKVKKAKPTITEKEASEQKAKSAKKKKAVEKKTKPKPKAKKKKAKTAAVNMNDFSQLYGDMPNYDELSIFIDVPPIGGGEIDVVIKDQEVFLPVIDLFDFLKIRTMANADLDSVYGFFINQDANYLIDRANNKIEYKGEVFDLFPDDLIRTEWNLYMRGDMLGEIFGLNCSFSFRDMAVKVLTDQELPAVREMRLAELRENIKRLKGEVKADTLIKRRYPFMSLGVADWSLNVTEYPNQPTDTRAALNLGTVLAGGETRISLNYNSQSEFSGKQQYYLWRRVNNDRPFMRQVRAGKIATGATASIYNPVIGVQFTNAPTTFRRSFGTYTLSDVTEPGWIVELYVNNALINYTKADAAGFFSFDVPLVYGNSMIKLKFYGPWGEEQTREKNINVPFNFLPVKTLEYTASVGMVEDSTHSQFSKVKFDYGLARRITIGGGVEYLSSVEDEPVMPFAHANVRVASNILLEGEYNHGIRYKSSLSYRHPSSVEVNFKYAKYEKEQKAIQYSYLEERKLSFAAPLRFRNFNAYNRVSINQLVLPTTQYTTSEWLFSGTIYKVNFNLTSYAFFIPKNDPLVYSNFALAFRLPRTMVLTAQAQYGYANNELISSKMGFEKKLFRHGYFQISYEHNFKSNLYMGEIGFRYEFGFANTSATTRVSQNSTTFVQNASGSIVFDRRTSYLNADNLSNVAKGGIAFIPFIDKNGNGKYEKGEPKIPGLKLNTSGGRLERDKKDTTIRLLGLEPYTEYFIELDQNSLDNIAWRLKHTTMKISVVPNMIKLMELPVYVVGEAAGSVMMEKKGQQFGLARVIVRFYDKDGKPVGKTLSEPDGYFSVFGLDPGTYTAKVDPKQLLKLDLESTPKEFSFTIKSVLEGDYVDGLDFVIRKNLKPKVETGQEVEE